MTTAPRFLRQQALPWLTAAVLVFGVAGCGGSDDGENSNTSGSPSSSGGPAPSTGPDADAESDDAAAVLDHEGALAAGFDHTAAITCGYTYDEEELAGIRVLAQTQEVPTEATIYLGHGAIYWEIPQPHGQMSHMLALDSFLYTWKIPEDSDGVKSPDATQGGEDDLKERPTRRPRTLSSNCPPT